jgi:hypothetical protein
MVAEDCHLRMALPGLPEVGAMGVCRSITSPIWYSSSLNVALAISERRDRQGADAKRQR